jgi:hypothetical protein
MINIDLFDDLLKTLKSISNGQNESYLAGKTNSSNVVKCSLHCVLTVFEILNTTGEALSIDLKDYCSSLYIQMFRVASSPKMAENWSDNNVNEANLLIKCLDWVLHRNRRLPIERIASFVKRLGVIALCSPGSAAAAYLKLIQNALNVPYTKLAI